VSSLVVDPEKLRQTQARKALAPTSTRMAHTLPLSPHSGSTTSRKAASPKYWRILDNGVPWIWSRTRFAGRR